ncbi:MAG TPA: glycosyltransferase family 39 protein [Acidimicrobiales bacterium]
MNAFRERVPTFDHVNVAAAIAIASGAALRLWMLFTSVGPYDSDEAVVGLMARRILDGELFTFYWGQPYGSSHEAFAVAALKGVGVPTRVAMELVPAALAIAAALLVWRIGVRLLGRTAGVLGAALFWTTSTAFVWHSTKERGFYGAMLVAGLGLLLLAIRLVDQVTWRDAALFGFVAGTGWWASPQVVYLAAPTGLWLLWEAVRARNLAFVKVAPVTAAAAAVGAAPWLFTNARTGWDSLRVATSVPDTTFGYRFGLFRVQAFPAALGAKLPVRGDWVGGVAGKAGFVVALAIIVAVLLRLPSRATPLRLGVVLYPLIFAAFPTSFYVAEPRYLSLLWPLVTLLFGFAIAWLPWGALRVAATASLAAITVVSSVVFVDYASETLGIVDVSPGEIAPVLRELRASRTDNLFADYWVANRITLETEEEIVAAPLQVVRYEPYERRVRADDNPPYVLFSDTCYYRELRRFLDENLIEYTATPAGRWTIVQPATKVLPDQALVDWASVRGDGPHLHIC